MTIYSLSILVVSILCVFIHKKWIQRGDTTRSNPKASKPSSTINRMTTNDTDQDGAERRANTQILMPPPPRPARPAKPSSSPAMKLQPPSTTLRVPTTGPLPNRGPPSISSNTLLPSRPTKPTATQNVRKRVILEPGHSPLDWAALSKSSNLSGVAQLLRVTPSMLRAANGRKDAPAWASFQGKVYNIKPYLPFHPGGKGELMRAAGKQAEDLFMEVHPWVSWESIMSACLVGFLVSEGDSTRP